jgi:hypothetical protein
LKNGGFRYETLLFCLARFSSQERNGFSPSFADPCRSSDHYQSFDLEWFAFQGYGNCKRIAFCQFLSDHHHYPQRKIPCPHLPFFQPFDFTYTLENSELGRLLLLSEARFVLFLLLNRWTAGNIPHNSTVGFTPSPTKQTTCYFHWEKTPIFSLVKKGIDRFRLDHDA